MLDKYRYHVDYFIKSFVFGFIFFVCWDLIFKHELVLLANIIPVALLTMLFAVFDFSNLVDKLQFTELHVNSVKEIMDLDARIRINANSIHDVIDKMRSSDKFKKVEIELLDTSQIKLTKKNLIRKYSWIYDYSDDQDVSKIEISVVLSKRDYFADNKRLEYLSAIIKLYNDE